MEEKKPNALSDEALDQVAGGDSKEYSRQIIIGGFLIRTQRDLYYFCYTYLSGKTALEIYSILSTCIECSLWDKYKIGGSYGLYSYLDKRLSQ